LPEPLKIRAPLTLQGYLNQVEEHGDASGFLTSDGKGGGFTRDYVVAKVINGVATKVE